MLDSVDFFDRLLRQSNFLGIPGNPPIEIEFLKPAITTAKAGLGEEIQEDSDTTRFVLLFFVWDRKPLDF